jgi:hypothetical protein
MMLCDWFEVEVIQGSGDMLSLRYQHVFLYLVFSPAGHHCPTSTRAPHSQSSFATLKLSPGSTDPCEAEKMTRNCATVSGCLPMCNGVMYKRARATPQIAIAVILLVIRRCTATVFRRVPQEVQTELNYSLLFAIIASFCSTSALTARLSAVKTGVSPRCGRQDRGV